MGAYIGGCDGFVGGRECCMFVGVHEVQVGRGEGEGIEGHEPTLWRCDEAHMKIR